MGSAQTHLLVAKWKENIQGIESGKSRVIYAKIIAEIDTLGTQKLPNKLERN